MQFYIKQWGERTVSLMTSSGHVLAYFPSIVEALAACSAWYQFNGQPSRDVVISDESESTIDGLCGLQCSGF